MVMEHKTQAGGYNGGGSTTIDSDSHTRQASGGGATHIASETGLLSTFENNKSSIYIVSSGGGGSAANSVIACSTGGSGGGIKGNAGQKFYESETVWGIGNGGTQEIGGDYSAASYTLQFTDYIGKGSFGKGATTVYSGGGAGLFGGGSALPSAGGGSSYIGNSLLTDKSMYCYNCEESTEESTLTISTTGNNELLDKTSCPTGYSSSPVSKCAKAGNGYAKITYLGN